MPVQFANLKLESALHQFSGIVLKAKDYLITQGYRSRALQALFSTTICSFNFVWPVYRDLSIQNESPPAGPAKPRFPKGTGLASFYHCQGSLGGCLSKLGPLCWLVSKRGGTTKKSTSIADHCAAKPHEGLAEGDSK